MKRTALSISSSERNKDRQLIRLDIPPTQAGIAAALRRAFAGAANECCPPEFEDLLRRL